MSEESDFEQFQDALAELLASGLTQSEILDTLKTDSRFDCYREYVNSFEPDMVAVACELMGRWAKRKE